VNEVKYFACVLQRRRQVPAPQLQTQLQILKMSPFDNVEQLLLRVEFI
jgi:hypothetical protein